MKSYIYGILLSLSYFTIIPTFTKHFEIDNKSYKALLFSFPLVGLLLGLISLGVFEILNTNFNTIYASIISAIIYFALYGFLHLEAVNDVADGWFASFSKDAYEVMKDPHVGAIGFITTLCVVIAKIAIITYLFYNKLFDIFLCGVILSRLSVLYNIYFFEFHEKSGFAKVLKQVMDKKLLILSTLFYIAIIWMFLDIDFMMLTLLAVLFGLSIFYILKRRFGFLNGDCIGFSKEIVEILVLNIGVIIC